MEIKKCQRCDKPLVKRQKKWCADCAVYMFRTSNRNPAPDFYWDSKGIYAKEIKI